MCIVSMRTCHKGNASGLMIISFAVCTHTNQCGLTICLVIVWATFGNMKKGRVDSALNTAPVVTCMKTLMMVFNFIFWVRIFFSVFSICGRQAENLELAESVKWKAKSVHPTGCCSWAICVLGQIWSTSNELLQVMLIFLIISIMFNSWTKIQTIPSQR